MDKIVEKNSVIAKYMGGVVIADYKGSKGGYFDTEIFLFEKSTSPTNSKYISDIDMRYHKEFNWLIPVIMKLQKEDETRVDLSEDFMTLQWLKAELRKNLSYDLNIERLFEDTYSMINLINKYNDGKI